MKIEQILKENLNENEIAIQSNDKTIYVFYSNKKLLIYLKKNSL